MAYCRTERAGKGTVSTVSISVEISDADASALRNYLTVHHQDLSAHVETELRRFLKRCDAAFKDRGTCPQCRDLFQKEVATKAIPVVDAETRGIVSIGRTFREYASAHDTQYVFCPVCLWEGFPDADQLT